MWDQRYSQPGYLFGTQANDFLREVIHQIPTAGRVLCLGEGEGRNGVFLASQGFQVTAMDRSRVGLEKAHALAQQQQVKIDTVEADLQDYDLGEAYWDSIVSIWVHVPVALREDLHRRVITALKPGGVFILEAYTLRHLTLDSIGGPPPTQPELYMNLKALRQELSDLDLLVAKEIDREIAEGSGHQGLSAVVQVVGRKSAKVS